MPEIKAIDPHDEESLRAWFDAMYAGAAAGRTRPLVWEYDELTASLRSPNEHNRRLVYAALVDDAVVGTLMLEFPMTENLQTCEWMLCVPPQHRRQGYATRLYEYGMDVAAQHGRTTHQTEVEVYGGEPVTSSPGSAFALKLGFRSEHQEDRLVLQLPVPDAKLSELAAHAAQKHGDYEFISWQGACPKEHLDAYVAMRNAMEHDVPTGTLDHEPTNWTAERIRTSESRMAEQGYVTLTAAARHRDGEFAGYSQLLVREHKPSDVMQDDTLVMTSHRGHRLGTTLKVLNLRTLAESFPKAEAVHTWTAGVNDAMKKINQDFGFESVEVMHEFQRVDG